MIQKEKIIFVSIYRSPRNDDENNKKLLDLLQAIGDMNIKYKLVCGDFNMPEIDWHRWVVKPGVKTLCTEFIEKNRLLL